MISGEEYLAAQRRAKEYLDKAGIAITQEEEANIEVADLGLGDLENTGVQILVYVNTERVCAPPVEGEPGKEETFRCRWGEMFLYIPGDPTPNPKARPPKGREHTYTAWHEIVLNPGDQYTLPPNTLHWFQGGDGGAVVSEFSTRSRDETDVFTDPQIQRSTVVRW